jgi:starch synthase
LSENYKEINILILGSGNQDRDQLNSLLDGNYNTFIGYNEELAFNMLELIFFDAI